MMNLFLDLNKAVQMPNTGTDAQSGSRSSREYKESFGRTHSGVTGGDASPDRPEVGKQWGHSDEGSLDEELEEDRKRDTEIAQERGIVAKPNKPDDKKPEETKKALDILKSFSGELGEQLAKHQPNEREIEYLTTVCGYEEDDIVKGRARIAGYERAKFNDWLHQRLRASLDRLVGR